jgi:hypothetical protein
MSPPAVTARLKLASELRELCLLLGTAKIESPPETKSLRPRKRRANHKKKKKKK